MRREKHGLIETIDTAVRNFDAIAIIVHPGEPLLSGVPIELVSRLTVEKYGRLIAKAFHEIPISFRNTLLPIRFGAWDLVSLYQLSDFLLHKDKYEDRVRHESLHHPKIMETPSNGYQLVGESTYK